MNAEFPKAEEDGWCRVEGAAALAGRVIIALMVRDSIEISRLSVIDAGDQIATLSHLQFAMLNAGSAAKLIAMSAQDLGHLDLLGGPVTLELKPSSSDYAATIRQVWIVTPSMVEGDKRLHAWLAGHPGLLALWEEIQVLRGMLLDYVPTSNQIQSATACLIGTTLVLDLKHAPSSRYQLDLVSPDFAARLTDFLRPRGRTEAVFRASSTRSFVAFGPVSPPAAQSFLVLNQCEGSAGVSRVPVDEIVSPEAMFERIWKVARTDGIANPLALKSVLAPLVYATRRGAALRARVHFLRAGPAQPRLSIVVPFYANMGLIPSILAQQALLAPLGCEMILVCDDPSAIREFRSQIDRCLNALAMPTIIVENEKNYGYGGANNLGAAVASGNHLLFMNSDVQLKEVGSVETALRVLAEDGCGLVGFKLHLPDGRLQHDGMTLVPHPAFGGLMVLDHPGKGALPDEAERERTVPVRRSRGLLVTGALLLIVRDLFRDIGGFSPGYVRGDFEDADLCRRIALRGLDVALVAAENVVHLERQSLGRFDLPWRTEAITFFNCAVFNENFILDPVS